MEVEDARIGFAPKTLLSTLVEFYLKHGDYCAVLIILYLAATKRCVWYRHLVELCKRVLGIEPSYSKIQSLLLTWKIHRIVEPCDRGSYRVGPGLEASPEDLKRAINLARQYIPQVLEVEEIREYLRSLGEY